MKFTRRTTLGALALVVAVSAAGCAGGGSGGDSAGGDPVEVDASLEDYQAAFADVEPIELTVQTFGASGASTTIDFERYMEAVTEWSDGKITFDINYSSAVAPATEVHQALNDGRLDLAYIFPGYAAEEFPINAAYSQASVLGDKDPVVGALSPYLWMHESFQEFEDEHFAEYEDLGLYPLLPVLATNTPVISCTQPYNSLDDLQGKTISATSEARVIQAEALGMTPVTLSYQETYEGLQRGVVDCIVSSAGGAVLGGLSEVAPHVLVSDDVAISADILPFVMSLDTWEGLPIQAQQLLFDRLDVIVAEDVHANWDDIVSVKTAAEASGGGIGVLEQDAEDALADANEEVLDQLARNLTDVDGATFVDFAQTASADADAQIKELGYDFGVGNAEFGDWYERDKVDLTAFTEYLFGEVLIGLRPE